MTPALCPSSCRRQRAGPCAVAALWRKPPATQAEGQARPYYVVTAKSSRHSSVQHRCLMEITVRERSRTSSQAASSIGLIVVAILILAGPIISIALALFLDLDASSSSGCSATTATQGQQCPAWYGYYEALVQGATVWFLYGVPRLTATLFTLHLAICAAYVGLIHLGIIDDR